MRKIVAQQLDRMMRVAPILSVILLIGNAALLLAEKVAWRGGPLYAWIIGMVIILLIASLTVSNLWAGPLRMVAAVRGSQALHDPVQVYQLTPFERFLWVNAMIPQMEHQLSLRPDPLFEYQINRLKRYAQLGYVPRDEYPQFLLRYYPKEGNEI